MSDPIEADTSWSPSVLGALSQRGTAAQAVADQSLDVEAQKQRAYDAAYAEGLAAGRAQAESIVAEMGSLLEAMSAPFEDTDAVLLRELLAVTEQVARAVVRRELEAGIDIERVLADALAALGSVSTTVQLTLNPMDASVCRDLGLVASERFEVLENSGLQRGGLQLRAGHSFVDASVESRIEASLSALRANAGIPEDDSEQIHEEVVAGDEPGNPSGDA
ncbi:FliH/SctL family protein [Congregibacter variabilis]|uniref:Flagellar assembly protein FliH n=1 Tax=Congregibacter variabilis TaxID=3081200 RepID=A0ABZ0I3V7_9GAMM|nr:FliH/SctL family protein [Congregibacter sp. IMCC43200]